MRIIKFSEYQEEKKAFLVRRARRLSELSEKDRISRRPIDAAQAKVLREADKSRSLRWQREGKMVWTGPREVKFKLSKSYPSFK